MVMAARPGRQDAFAVAEHDAIAVMLEGSVRADQERYAETQVTREPWRAGLDLISVSVPVVDGKRYVLRRLVSAQTLRSASVAR